MSTYFWPYREDKFPKKEKINGDISDSPITYTDEDLLNRGQFVKGLYKELDELIINESFVYGLDGSWGDGKTSVLNLLRQLIYNNPDKPFLLVNFDPWNFKDEEAMLKAFFNQLEKSISSVFLFPNLKKEIIKYQKLITSGISNFGINVDLGLKEETIDEIKENIESYIQKTGKKILIIIDEIDRLQEDEILMIFKLVRANSKFENTIFILSLDTDKIIDPHTRIKDEYLKKIIQKPISLPKIENTFINNFVIFSQHKIPKYLISNTRNVANGQLISISGFISDISNTLRITEKENGQGMSIKIQGINPTLLEKLQSELKLNEKIFVEGEYKNGRISLNSSDSVIKKYKLSRIDALFEKLLIGKKVTEEEIAFFDKEFVYLYNTTFCKLMQNFRDAKLFLNSLYSSLPPIASEVNIFDFTILELIKVFAEPVYEDIFKNWWIYVDERYEKDYLSNPFSTYISNETDKRNTEIRTHLTNLLARYDSNLDKKSVIQKALYTLFPNLNRRRNITKKEREEKRIFTTSFIKYFTLSTASLELPDSVFIDTLKQWRSKKRPIQAIVSSFREMHSEDKLQEFLDKIRRIYSESLSEKESVNIIRAVYRESINFSRKNIRDSFDSEYDLGTLLTLNLLNNKIAEGQIQNTLEEIISKSPDFSLAVDIVLTTKQERNGDLFNIYKNVKHLELRKILSDRLEEEFIKKKVNIFDRLSNGKQWRRVLYQWASNWSESSSPTSPNKDLVTNYIVKLTNRAPKRLIMFLHELRAPFATQKWDYNPTDYDKVYELKSLITVARKHASNKQLSKEEQEMIKIFIDKTENHLNNVKEANIDQISEI